MTALTSTALDVVSAALQGSGNSKSAKRTPTWVRLVVMRLIGVVPWSGINIACGVCRVPFVECAIGAFIGTLPWTAVTCQFGHSPDAFFPPWLSLDYFQARPPLVALARPGSLSEQVERASRRLEPV
ncbi:hypothetical protein RSAG8_03073, partial [Rhizoctonia solani AG-8 WAC10335]